MLYFCRKPYHCFLQLKGFLVFGRRVGILGNFTVVNPRNVTIGDRCGVNDGVFILGHNRVEIGSDVVLSARCMLIDTGLNLTEYANINSPVHTEGFIRIEDGVWVGAGAIILPGVDDRDEERRGCRERCDERCPAFHGGCR